MRKVVISTSIIFLLVLLDFNISPRIRILGINLELLIITIIFVSLFFNKKSAFSLTIFAGMLKDILCSARFGVYTTCFAISTILIHSINRWIAKATLFIEITTSFLAIVFILSFLELSGYIFKTNMINLKIIFLESILPRGIVNAMLAPLFFKILSKILR